MMKFKEIRNKIVAFGTYLYDGAVPYYIDITEYKVEFACSRYDDDEMLDKTTPIPESPNGKLYRVAHTSGVDFKTLEEAKNWANSQPWGPVTWK